jgi:hypothetical protein
MMDRRKITHTVWRPAGAAFIAVALLLLASATTAFASGPWWHLNSDNWPATLPANGEGTVVALAENLGDAPAANRALTVTDRLPAGVTPRSVGFFISPYVGGKVDLGAMFCNISGREVTCELPESVMPFVPFPPYESVEMRIGVKVEGTPTDAVNEFNIAGAEAPPASLARPLTIGSAPSPFGVSNYELTPENADGSVDTQAGSHPFQLTSTVMFNQTADPVHPPGQAKDLYFELPPGLIGNPTPIPQCTPAQFSTRLGHFPVFTNACPADTAVGVADITVDEPEFLGVTTAPVPLFNLTPAVGEPARFAFVFASVPVILDTSVRTGGDYGVTVTVKNVSELANFISSRVTFWGVPGDPAHDNARGWSCIYRGEYAEPGSPPCAPSNQPKPPPFLSLPTSCTGQLQTSIQADSWEQRDAVTPPLMGAGEPALDGCDSLPFAASIGVTPDGQAGSTPTGLTVHVHVPQEEALNPAGLAPADVKDTRVTLPAGVALNPAAGDGLLSCSESQVGLSSGLEASCPEASKVGTVEINSPLLPNPIVGAAYLAEQNRNPFGSLLALYLVARDPVSGFLLKVAGEVKPDPATGQLVSTFLNTPQLPFEDLKLHFFGGSRAPLATPSACGPYTTAGLLAPWSGNQPVEVSSTFQILSGPDGSPCSDPLPFSPELTAGSLNIQAGAFTSFTMTMSRQDGEQNLDAIQLHMPPGLSGVLDGVKLCPEPQADMGTCGPDSLIGETTISVGVGGTPFTVKGGKVYITGPYRGAPFGLSIVNPAKAGPLDVGQGACDCVVVRAKIDVDPTTSALTVTSDSTGPYRIPTILDGIPLQIKHVNVTVSRPEGFTFNPTSCKPMAITGSLTSSEGATSALSVPFQVTNCATLSFKPQFEVSTGGKPSRANGASLDVRLSYPKAAWGSQANVRYVKVELPKQLPSRLGTLQQACPDTTFDRNPAACPGDSRVGSATATTPIIPESLSGPAYFVSHGGAKFPELVIVLSGYGVTVQLHGETFINERTGVTSSTFKTIPDIPVGMFELKLPQGPYSALAANSNVCRSTLRMPTTFIAQNGLSIRRATPIAVTGCRPTLRVLHESAKGPTATLSVEVPFPGRLSASGRGLSRALARVGRRGVTKLALTLSRGEQRLLAIHPGRRLRVRVRLMLTSAHGKRLSATATVLMR